MDIGSKDLLSCMTHYNVSWQAIWGGTLNTRVNTLSRMSYSDGTSGPSWAQKGSASVRYSDLSGQPKQPLETTL